MKEMGDIRNKDGMRAMYSYAVYNREDLFALGIIGADTAVKAIHATLRMGKEVWLDGWMRRKMAVDFRVERTVLEGNPPLFRWHVIPVVSENDPAVPVYGWDEILSREDALVGALARWTVWPALPEWGEVLFRLGQEHSLIWDIPDREGVDYAFMLVTQGWGEVIDQAVKDGLLSLPD